MERRSFFAALAAPLFRRFVPIKPEPPVASVSIMGSGKLTPFAFGILINGDLDSLRDTPALLGRAAGEHWQREIAALMDATSVTVSATFDPTEQR